MSYDQQGNASFQNGGGYDDEQQSKPRYRDEVYSRRVSAGKRTYFFDVKPTRSGDDFFITITESKYVDGGREKYKVFLYKEDFGKFVRALHDVVGHIRDERLPDYDFEALPELTGILDQEEYS